MAHEKHYTAKQVAFAVLEKIGELMKSSELSKAEPTPWKGSNSSSKGVNAPLPTRRKIMENPARSHGESDAGVALRNGMKGAAKQFHRETVSELKEMPAPNLPKSEKCAKCGEEMKKGETKHDRCVEHVKENSPEVKNPHAVCVAEGVKPAAWGKSEEAQPKRPAKEDTTKEKPAHPASPNDDQNAENQHPQGKAPKGEIEPKEHVEGKSDDVREQAPPSENTHEQAEGNNEPAGTTPKDGIEQNEELKGHLKLAKFIGRMEQKRVSKKTQSRAR